MNWKKKLKVIIDYAFDIIPESCYEEFTNALIKVVFEYYSCLGMKNVKENEK